MRHPNTIYLNSLEQYIAPRSQVVLAPCFGWIYLLHRNRREPVGLWWNAHTIFLGIAQFFISIVATLLFPLRSDGWRLYH